MARSNVTSFTQKEIDNYKAFCREHNIVADESEAGLRNGTEIGNYIAITWGQDITPETLAVALDRLRDRIVFYTPAQVEYIKVADENPTAANQLNAWFENQNTLVKEGDLGLQNQTTLLTELRGREITKDNIAAAIGRIKAPVSRFHTARRPLHFVQAPRRTEPQSRAAKEDDSTSANWLGRDLVQNSDGSWRSKTPAEQRADREAAERAKSQAQTPTLDASEQAWKAMADGLLSDGTHSQQARVRAIYDREQGNSWRHIYEACKREVNLSRNRAFVR